MKKQGKMKKKINCEADWENTPIEGVEWTVLSRAIPLKHPFFPKGFLSTAGEILSYIIGCLYIGLVLLYVFQRFGQLWLDVFDLLVN